MKYYIIAGERSGDLHASNLIKSLKDIDKESYFRVLGGEMMEAAGAQIYRYYHEINYMGVWEVVKNLYIILKNLKQCQADLLADSPDVLILVDFGGFNMKMAKFATSHNIKVFYYISPKIWAWNTGRAYSIKKYVDRMFVILPFEKEFYKQFDYEVDYVGNPVNDCVSDFREDESLIPYFQSFGKPIVAILPGSRKYEVQNMFSVIGEVVALHPELQFVVAGVDSLSKHYYTDFKQKYPQVEIIFEKTYDILANAKGAIVTSGTASLETALLDIPHVVVFKANAMSYAIAMMVLKIKFVSLPNLIVGYGLVPELLQKNFSAPIVDMHLNEILYNAAVREKHKTGYQLIRNILGAPGTASFTAKLMVEYLTDK